jgi:hypothetical protein
LNSAAENQILIIKRLYFHSYRPLTKDGEQIQDTDIWYVERTGRDWGEHVHLDSPINSDKYDVGPRITDSGDLYFSSDRDEGNSDIYRTAFVDGRFSNPEKIQGLVNTENYETISCVAPDESFLIFYYNYPGETFVPGLMISFRKEDGSWAKPVDMKEKLGLKANDLLHASLSPDGKYLFIQEDMDIYWVDAKIIEGFKPEGLYRRIAVSIPIRQYTIIVFFPQMGPKIQNPPGGAHNWWSAPLRISD